MAHKKNTALPMLPEGWKPTHKRTGKERLLSANVLNAILRDYATTQTPLKKIANSHRTSQQRVYEYIAAFPVLAEQWQRAQQCRAEVIVAHASDRFTRVEERLDGRDVDYREIHARTNLAAAQARHDQWLAGKWSDRYADRPADISIDVNVGESLEGAWDRRRAVEAEYSEGETDA